MRTVAWEKLSELPMELALRSTKTPQNLTLVPYQQLSSIVESEKVHILCVVPLMHQGLYKWDSCPLWSKAKNCQIVWRKVNPISWW